MQKLFGVFLAGIALIYLINFIRIADAIDGKPTINFKSVFRR